MSSVNYDNLLNAFKKKETSVIETLYNVLEHEGLIQNIDLTDKANIYLKNTKLLLKNYRALIYSLSYSGAELAQDLDCKSLKELEVMLSYWRDFSSFGNKIPEDIAVKLESEMKALKLLNRLRKALTILKQKPYCYNGKTRNKISGKMEFYAIYYSYIEMPNSFCTSEIIKRSNDMIESEELSDHMKDYDSGSRSDEDIAELLGISDRDFRILRKAAIDDLSAILWGGYTREISFIIEFLSGIDF